MSELELQNKIRLTLACYPGLHLFRANLMGTAWVGKASKTSAGALVIRSPRRIEGGLPNGFPDLFGYLRTKMGAIFVGMEVKEHAKVTDEQRAFLQELYDCGGRAGVARCVIDAHRILEGEFLL